MSEAIIVALITGASAVFAQLVIYARSSNDLYTKLDKKIELSDQRLESRFNEYRVATDTKIDELTREVREHNNFARRFPVIETKVEALEKATAK